MQVPGSQLHRAHDVIVKLRLWLGPVDGQRQTPQLDAGTDEATAGHGRVVVGLELHERKATVARLVTHIRVHDDVTTSRRISARISWRCRWRGSPPMNRRLLSTDTQTPSARPGRISSPSASRTARPASALVAYVTKQNPRFS